VAHCRFLAVEDACRATESLALLAADFRDRSVWREIAAQNDQVAVLLEGIANGRDDLLILWIRFERRKVLLERLAGHREAASVQQPGLKQLFHHWDNASDLNEFAHQEAPAGQ